MARQRFIWPSIWTDPTFGRLQPQEQVMFIGLFSIADDDGRLMGSPEYLRGELYRYKDMSARKVKGVRDAVLAACPNVLLYVANEIEYIQLTKWSEYQRPKYPKPSKLPPPPTQNPRKNRETDGLDSPKLPPSFPQASPKLPEALEEASPKLSPMWVGLGWVGMGWEGMG